MSLLTLTPYVGVLNKLWRKTLWVLLFATLLFTFSLYYYMIENGEEQEKVSYKRSITNELKHEQKFNGLRFVHLDLKGAPPKISYFDDLFPLLAKLGATGLLIEYEDMFPYTGELLQVLPARNAYTHSNINYINLLAAQNNLTVIPLVQTFGHLEFILKLKQFKFLREVPQYPQVICPNHNMTLNILLEMVYQVIQAHPHSTRIHIGADEVYHIGQCATCKQILLEERITEKELFLNHIKRVAQGIKRRYPYMKVLMWDDEFRSIEEEKLKQTSIGEFVEPIVWKYSQDLAIKEMHHNIIKYSEVFNNIWLASAFKGATGSNQYLTPVAYHIANHKSWMKLYSRYKNVTSIAGIFITGWQRYDHFSVLCELLPVGIPSLGLCLGVLLGEEPVNTYKLLQCDDSSEMKTYPESVTHCRYPGSEVLDGVIAFHHLNSKFQRLKENSVAQGWMTNYNRRRNFSNPYHLENILNELVMFLGEISHVKTIIVYNMSKVYDYHTIAEWQEIFLDPISKGVEELMEQANYLLSFDDWPRRPL